MVRRHKADNIRNEIRRGLFLLQDLKDPQSLPKEKIRGRISAYSGSERYDIYTAFHYIPRPGLPLAPIVTYGGEDLYVDAARRRYAMDETGNIKVTRPSARPPWIEVPRWRQMAKERKIHYAVKDTSGMMALPLDDDRYSPNLDNPRLASLCVAFDRFW